MAIAPRLSAALSGSGATPRVVTIATLAGDTIFVHATFNASAAAVTGVTDTGGSVYTKVGEVTQGALKIETWRTGVGAALASSSVSVAFSGAPTDMGVQIECYTGVVSIGNYFTAQGATGAATITAAIQDANGYLVAGIGGLNGTTLFTTSAGTQRSNDGGAVNIIQDLVDATSASPGNVSCSTSAPTTTPWAIGALELRPVAGSGSPAPVTNPLPSRFMKANPRFNTLAPASGSISFRRTLHPFGAGKGKRTRGR